MLKILPGIPSVYPANRNNIHFRAYCEPELPECIGSAVKKYCKPGITTGIVMNKLQQHVGVYARYDHCISTSQKAAEIARENGVNEQKAALAGLLHDYARVEELVSRKTDLLSQENSDKNTHHGIVGADMVEKDFGITDSEILNAIKNHTLGSRNPEKEPLSPLDMVLIVADRIEPLRSNYDKTKQAIAGVMETTGNLKKATATYFNHYIRKRMAGYEPVDRTIIDNYNALVK